MLPLATFQTRQRRLTRYPWLIPNAVWGFKTHNLTAPQFWRNDQPSALADVLANTRAGDAIKADVAFNHHVFGTNAPAILGGLGLDCWGQFSSRLANGHNLAAAGWGSVGGLTVADLGPSPLGVFQRARLASGGATADRRRQTANMSAGVKYYVTALYEPETSGNFRVQGFGGGDNIVIVGSPGNPNTSTNSGGLLGGLAEVNVVGNLWHRSFFWTPSVNTNYEWNVGPQSGVEGASVIVHGFDVVAAGIATPWISNASPAPTRFADALSIPDFPSIVSTHGLQDGFAGRDTVNLARLGDSSNRYIWSYGTVTDGVRLFYTTANLLRMETRKGGSAVGLVTTSAVNAPGVWTIDYQCKPGAYWMRINGGDQIAPLSGAGETLPDISGERAIGRLVTNSNSYFRGAILSSQIARAA
ncbi:hypothetical protein [Parvibaculum sp.]|uniref:hypothetical protein n=1 Tax=Parvibaculum sp. TaxID=2024848 RepID=UPI002733F770|nr:hypothetical protein [Parvibaculum sp.]MDP3329431.1 hypothetical protein [Parvibaculum sp.]